MAFAAEGKCAPNCQQSYHRYMRCVLDECGQAAVLSIAEMASPHVGRVPFYPYDQENCAVRNCGHLFNSFMDCMNQKIRVVQPGYENGKTADLSPPSPPASSSSTTETSDATVVSSSWGRILNPILGLLSLAILTYM